jgi:8-oxo-dGTP pyrophosphatase MutT (NUDIX family)
MAPDTPVVPKPAATVVLVRRERGTVEVFLTKRPRSMAFLGGYYVFPGGGVDSPDTEPRATDRIIGADHDDIGKLKGDGRNPLGFYTAAVRELFEEAGVLLLCDEAGKMIPGQLYGEMRLFVAAIGASFVDEVVRRGLFFAGHRLKFLQLFTTPAFSPMRFQTVFFIAGLPEGQQAGVENTEVERSLWITPAEALERNRSGEFPMIPPTMAALHMVIGREGVMSR